MVNDIGKIRGEYAWGIMALGITAYDIYAVKSKKMETLSSTIWRSLKNPLKLPLMTVVWSILTYHLFGNKNARTSIRALPHPMFVRRGYFYE